jgi:hypothetical protein
LLNVYLDPARLDGLERELLAKAEAKSEGAPAAAARLRGRLEDLEQEVRQGRRNLLRAMSDQAFLEADAGLNEWLAKRDRLRKELEASERAQRVPAEEAAGRVRRALAKLRELRAALEQEAKAPPGAADRAKLGEVLRLLVTRVDLYFEPEQHGRRVYYRFVKGAVKVRPILAFKGCGEDLTGWGAGR